MEISPETYGTAEYAVRQLQFQNPVEIAGQAGASNMSGMQIAELTLAIKKAAKEWDM